LSTPDVVDPQKSSITNEIAILSLNYEGLTKLNSDLKPAPAAAESWQFNEAGDVITFTLRDNLKYSDGSPLTSENFRYAIERTCDPNTAGQYQFILAEIQGCAEFSSAAITDTAALEAGRRMLNEQGVQTPDEQTLVLNLTNPAPYFPYIAGLWVMYPAKQELIEAGGENWWKDAKNQIGNGPFQLTQYNEGQLATFKANENYWEGRPKLDGIEYVYQGDTAIAQEAYRAGQLDIIQPDPSQITAIREDPQLKEQLLTYGGANTFAMGFNLNKEPFNDKKVREAFAYAFDRDTFCNVIRNGDCVPAYSWIPEGVGGHIDTDAYKFDPAKAKQALAESSYGGPDKLPPIKFSYNADDPSVTPRWEWLANQLREHLGVNVTLDPQEGKAINAARKSNETYPQWYSFATNWFQDYPDPQNWLSTYWNSNSFAKRIGYKNEQLDALMRQADTTLDPAKREELNKQANQILIDDLPAPFGYSEANVFLVKPEVTGYKTTSADSEIPGQWGSLLTLDVNR
jgi:oligopeptide transport system substrate-binding protein